MSEMRRGSFACFSEPVVLFEWKSCDTISLLFGGMPGLTAGSPTHNFGSETPSGYAWPFPPLLVMQRYE